MGTKGKHWKLSELAKENHGNRGKKHSEETKREMSKARRGKSWGHHTEEAKRKMSIIHKKLLNHSGRFKVGHGFTEEIKRKISKTLQGRYQGEKNPNWRGGTSFEPYGVDWTETLRRSIRERDHYICQLCSQYGNTVHHIDYNKKDCSPNNLITLCRTCNGRVNFKRKYWTDYFKQYVERKRK